MTGIQRTGSVYFAKVGDYVKIGFASNPRYRLEHLLVAGSKLIVPADIDRTVAPDLVLVIPFCSMRDERSIQLLFGNHWVVGEWFRWSPAFQRQMRSMSYQTHAVRRKNLADHRRTFGGRSCQKEERWGMNTQDLLAHLAEWRRSQGAPARAA